MSITTRGFGSSSITTVGFGTVLASFLPNVFAYYYSHPAYAWVIHRGYLEIRDVRVRTDLNLRSLVARVKIEDIPLRDWESVVDRVKGSIPVRSPGWPEEYE